MPLETGTYIQDLDALNPFFDDFVKEADDHLRLIKSVLKNTFPNAVGAIPISGDGSNLLVPSGGIVTSMAASTETGSLYLPELADHLQVPGAGFAELWLSTDGNVYLTNAAGTDINLTSEVDVSGTPLVNQIPLWVDSNTLRGVAGFEFDTGTNVFTVGDGSDQMQWQTDQLLLSIGGDIFGEWLQGNIISRDSSVANPTTGGTIDNKIDFESQDQNLFGEMGYLDGGADAFGIRNFAYDADMFLFVTDGTSTTSDYGITFNSQALQVDLDVNGTPDTIFDIDTSGSTTIADTLFTFYGPVAFQGDVSSAGISNWDLINASAPVNLRLAGDGADAGVGSLDLISAAVGDQILSRANASQFAVGTLGGSDIIFYDDAHATLPGDFSLRSNSLNVINWDESTGDLSFLTDTGAKTLALTLNSSQNAVFAGTIDANETIGVAGTVPQWFMDETDAGVDQGIWRTLSSGGSLFHQIRDDANANALSYITVNRSGTGAGINVDSMTIAADTIDLSGNTTFNAVSFDAAIAAAPAVAANTAKVSNATHTGDVTGATVLTIAAGAVDIAMLANGTDGELITWDAAGAPATVPVGTATHVLTSNGAGAAPTFQAAAAGLTEQSGSFAPTFTASTGTITVPTAGSDTWYYRKIGSLVVVTGNILIDSVSSPTGTLTWTNPPFDLHDDTGIGEAGLGMISITNKTANDGFHSLKWSGTTEVIIRNATDGNVAAEIQAFTAMHVTFTYFTDE